MNAPYPDPAKVDTYYSRPMLDRWTGRYTVSLGDGSSIQRHNRFVDLQGLRPSWSSVRRLPMTFWTWLQTRRSPLLKSPLPLLTWESIDFLKETLPDDPEVVEVGAGNSTLWLLAQGARVTTIEHCPRWAKLVEDAAIERFGPEIGERFSLHVNEGHEAIELLENMPPASVDLALVDSANGHTQRWRALTAVRSKVRPGGFLALDNSDHPNNWGAAGILNDLSSLRFTGYGPMCAVVTQTQIWRM